jgi:hypothetical protein
MKPIPLPVRPEPVELLPVSEHRVSFDVGPDTVSVVLTGSLERTVTPPKRKTPAQVRPIAADKSRGPALEAMRNFKMVFGSEEIRVRDSVEAISRARKLDISWFNLDRWNASRSEWERVAAWCLRDGKWIEAKA